MNLFESAKQFGVIHIKEWLPGGDVNGGQWVVKNPMRNDNTAGSFKVNLSTGAANDYADDFVGHDAVSLYAYLNGMSNLEAAKEILTRYDPSYFPGKDDFKKIDTWYQLSRGHRAASDCPLQVREIARWPLEIKVGSEWRTVMMICRFQDEDGGKKDLPHTLWTDGKAIEWRRKALHGVKYPLYGLRALAERPNARVLLTEGQKTAAVTQVVLGDNWVCVGWYGGAGNSHLTDWEPLIGREVWYTFDGDAPGRKAIKSILEEQHVKAHLVYPPAGVDKGWDIADAVTDGWTREQVESHILAETVNAPVVITSAPENRPTRLDTKLSEDLKEYVMDNIYEEKKGKEGEPKFMVNPNWFYWIIEQDAAIKNCIKYDYTTGTKSTAYESSDLFDAALERRLQAYGIPANLVTRTIKERMMGEILLGNSKYNRVADYIDNLILQYGAGSDTLLDEFMLIFGFNIELKYKETQEQWIARSITVVGLYRELFHKFFLRMHGRIKGTRKNDADEYLGLMENDIVPILEGPQEIGKTSFCKWLACDSELYIDLGSGTKQMFGSAETVKKIRGRLIAEIGEMKIMKNADMVETIKSFISMATATVDIKYVESQRDIPLTTSFIGTSNPEQYLSDDTGNRRWWPVKLKSMGKEYMSAHKDLAMKLHAHYQVLALGMSTKEIFESCMPSPELRAFMEELRQDALITYSDYEVCLRVLKKWKENNALGGSLLQADVERLAVEDRYMTRISPRSFNRAIRDAGFKQAREWDTNTGKASREWQWVPKGLEYGDEVPF